jgi:hypothetical protein
VHNYTTLKHYILRLIPRQLAHFFGGASTVLSTIIAQGVGYQQLLDDLRAIIRYPL